MSSLLAGHIILTQRGRKLRYHVFFPSQSHYTDTEREPEEISWLLSQPVTLYWHRDGTRGDIMSSFPAGHIILTQRGNQRRYHVFFPSRSHYTDTEREPEEISWLLSQPVTLYWHREGTRGDIMSSFPAGHIILTQRGNQRRYHDFFPSRSHYTDTEREPEEISWLLSQPVTLYWHREGTRGDIMTSFPAGHIILTQRGNQRRYHDFFPSRSHYTDTEREPEEISWLLSQPVTLYWHREGTRGDIMTSFPAGHIILTQRGNQRRYHDFFPSRSHYTDTEREPEEISWLLSQPVTLYWHREGTRGDIMTSFPAGHIILTQRGNQRRYHDFFPSRSHYTDTEREPEEISWLLSQPVTLYWHREGTRGDIMTSFPAGHIILTQRGNQRRYHDFFPSRSHYTDTEREPEEISWLLSQPVTLYWHREGTRGDIMTSFPAGHIILTQRGNQRRYHDFFPSRSHYTDTEREPEEISWLLSQPVTLYWHREGTRGDIMTSFPAGHIILTQRGNQRRYHDFFPSRSHYTDTEREPEEISCLLSQPVTLYWHREGPRGDIMSSFPAGHIILTQRGNQRRYHVFFPSRSHYTDTEGEPEEISWLLSQPVTLYWHRGGTRGDIMSSFLAGHIILTQRGTQRRYHDFFPSRSHYTDTERDPEEISWLLSQPVTLYWHREGQS